MTHIHINDVWKWGACELINDCGIAGEVWLMFSYENNELFFSPYDTFRADVVANINWQIETFEDAILSVPFQHEVDIHVVANLLACLPCIFLIDSQLYHYGCY